MRVTTWCKMRVVRVNIIEKVFKVLCYLEKRIKGRAYHRRLQESTVNKKAFIVLSETI